MERPAVLQGLPEELAEAVGNFSTAVEEIETRVRQLLQAPWAELCNGLPPLESARIHLMVAYTVNTLFYLYLKTQGISASEHPVREELERVKTYIRKVKEATKEVDKSAQEEKRQLTVNASAAHRFIAHALSAQSDKAAAPADPSMGDSSTAAPAASGDGAGGSREGGPAGTESVAEDATARAEKRVARQRVEAVEETLRREMASLRKQVAVGDAAGADTSGAKELASQLQEHAVGMGLDLSNSTKTKRKQQAADGAAERASGGDAKSGKKKKAKSQGSRRE